MDLFVLRFEAVWNREPPWFDWTYGMFWERDEVNDEEAVASLPQVIDTYPNSPKLTRHHARQYRSRAMRCISFDGRSSVFLGMGESQSQS